MDLLCLDADFGNVLKVDPVEYTDLCDPIKLGVFLPGVAIMISDIIVNLRIIKMRADYKNTTKSVYFQFNVCCRLLFIIIILQGVL